MASRRKNDLLVAPKSNLESLESRVLFAVAVAENLLVSIDATALPAGTATSVANTGTLGGTFGPTGGDDTTVPVIGRPDARATAGTQGIRFDGTDFLQLLDGPDGSLITAPAGITGTDATTSIEAWVWNPGIANEETVLSWGKRGGPDGTNMSFNYGNNPDYGAVGHWGAPDIGWGPNVAGGAPAAKNWHLITYTYDGTTTRVYADGQLLNSEVLGAGILNTAPDTAINLATQLEADGVTPTGALRGSLTLGRVRIHDGVLTDAEIAGNYNAEKADFVEPTIPVEPPPPAEVLVNIDATKLAEGVANDIPNTGPLGGVFEGTGGDGFIPVIAKPLDEATAGTVGIRFDGDDYMQLLDGAGGNLINAPSSITGLDPKTSIETWVWNPSISPEETMLSWGKRGGPDGTNMSFNYGSNGDYGAVGHWGSPDIGYGPNGAPGARHWHLITYTFDGETQRVYSDGVQVNSEVLGPGVLNTAPNTAINLATQLEADGTTPTGALRGTLTLGRVRIYKGVLTDTQISTNYNNEKADFVEPTVPPPPAAEILVNVDATKLPEGVANDIPNTGPLGGVFEATGGEGFIPVIAPPLTSNSTGTRGIRLDGDDYLQLVDGAGGSLITAPASITGVNPPRSVETWVWNPNVTQEETMVSWGHRGGPDGSNMSFNYGSDSRWGANAQWGDPDIGWGPIGTPPPQQWHLLTYTYDGATSRVYMDGQLQNSESLAALNTHPDTPISLGTQIDNDGSTPFNGGNRGSLTLGRVRIYSGTLTDAQILANYNNEKGDFVNPTVTPATLTAGPTHRYSFSNAAGDASGATITDSIGGANGVVQGAGATFTGGKVSLPGGSSNTAAYIDLPNGLLSSLGASNGGTGKVSFEGWVTHTGNQPWSRFYDFGSTNFADANGELTGPGTPDGSTVGGSDYWMFTAQNGTDLTVHRFELANFNDPDAPGNRFVDVSGSTLNTTVHFVATWDEATGQVTLFENGTQIGSLVTPALISAINDVNDWLGRSNYTADSNLQGDYDEFRIYNRVLTPGEILGDFQAGPDVVNTGGAGAQNVYVRGSAWTPTFRTFLSTQAGQDSTAGFKVTGFNATSPVLSFSNLNTVALKFAGAIPAGLTAGSVAITSAAGRTYTVTGVAADPSDPTIALVSLNTPITNDRVRVQVASANVDVRLNVLPADVNQSGGAVNAADLVLTRNRIGRTTANPGTGGTAYSIFNDVDGNGLINASDLVLVRNNVGKLLPAALRASVFGASRIAPAPRSSNLASVGLEDSDDAAA